MKTIVSAASCLTGLHVSLRRAPKNYPSEGNFLEASHVNVELPVVQILWQENYQNTWNIDKQSTIASKSQEKKLVAINLGSCSQKSP